MLGGIEDVGLAAGCLFFGQCGTEKSVLKNKHFISGLFKVKQTRGWWGAGVSKTPTWMYPLVTAVTVCVSKMLPLKTEISPIIK